MRDGRVELVLTGYFAQVGISVAMHRDMEARRWKSLTSSGLNEARRSGGLHASTLTVADGGCALEVLDIVGVERLCLRRRGRAIGFGRG
jgi:hypothetical protein